jgi:transposase
MSFPFSNAGFVYPLPAQNQECFLEGMKRLFEHIGGVPRRLRFDNLPAAVVSVGKGGERELTEMFTRFKLHYRFEAEFCGPAKGNEKGHVENKVGYTRRQ